MLLGAVALGNGGCDRASQPQGYDTEQLEILEVLRDAGYEDEHIGTRDGYAGLVVQGDIGIDTATAAEMRGNGFRQWRDANIVTLEGGYICVEKAVSAANKEELRWDKNPNIGLALEEALRRWNALSIKYTFTTDTSVDCKATIKMLISAEENTDGLADFPEGGKPGPQILISKKYQRLYDDPCKQFGRNWGKEDSIATVMHELGHAMGLRHSDWDENGEDRDGAQLIPGTPEDEPYKSVMNSDPNYELFKVQSEWTAADKLAIETLYGA
ncbi:MAG: M57 family metalloprotease [Myxococcota bacterium]